MKKWLLILCMIVVGGSVMSQNVIGKPKYYKDSTQYTPGHGMGYEAPSATLGVHKSQLGHPFNVVFLETTTMVGGSDIAFGLNLAVVPSAWGVYGSALWGFNYNWYKAGAIWRISRPNEWIDWQLYGGVVCGERYNFEVGGELGFRFAMDNIYGSYRFSWWSMSMGIAVVRNSPFFTFGLSIGLSGLSLPAILIL